ncbi:hypothetical protein BS47DRAFT_1370221 [Hydnum rufescens UP504]|uniref:Splicing factor 3A subunit 1 n=1 Tax=Hydnum rufescens UP504 TaxID=1448309 RepID=A0A9P6BB11_9AGAM|nr:hypothetical protein BS47DRAFT_1370221 [Hydnum rufescens UP504]
MAVVEVLPPVTNGGISDLSPSLNGSGDDVMANGDSTLKSVPKFISGMIYPPPELRTIIDSTAGFVAVSANSVQFEEKIRENHRQDPKWSFLNAADPYHAYYRHRIEKIREGGDAAALDAKEAAAASSAASAQIKGNTPLDSTPREPPTLPFVLDVPHKNALDLYVTFREGRNYQFDFLRPDHSLFSYFNHIVEQYSRVLGPEGRSNLLSDARERGEWERFQRERESKRAKERDEEAIAFAEIDWHDFAIVQTIEFTQVDAQSELPLPMTIAEVENMTLTQKRMAAMITENTAPEVEAHKASQAAADAAAAAAKAEEVASRPADNMEMDVASDEEDDQQAVQKEEEDQARARELQARSTEHGAPMKIRKDYVPKSLAARAAKATVTICSICGLQIPVDELEEHMRIELLDPKWKSQRDAIEARRAQANELQRGANVGSALKQLARARADLFDGDDEKRKREEEEENLRRKEREKAVWDGHTASKANTLDKYQTNVNFDEQIAAIHKAHGLGPTDTSTIGPAIGPSINPIATSSLPPPPISLPQNPNTLAAQGGNAYAGAVISAEPQPPSVYMGGMHHPLPLTPTFGGPPTGPGVPLGMHPSRLAALGGLPTRPADGAPEAEPVAKRPRIERPEGHYYPEEDWISMHPAAIVLSVQLPNISDKPEWNLNGAIATIPDIPLTLLISSLRDRIIAHIKANIPASRIKLSFRNKVLTNANTLASYNMDDDDLIVMTLRDPPKKKK